jgi:hypothetical protein
MKKYNLGQPHNKYSTNKIFTTILFLFDYFLCDCPKLYLFVKDTTGCIPSKFLYVSVSKKFAACELSDLLYCETPKNCIGPFRTEGVEC